MATITPTNVGRNSMAAAIEPTHVQVLSAALDPASIPTLTAILPANVIKNWNIVHKIIVDSQVQVLAQDQDLSASYTNARTWVVWNGAPGQAGSQILGAYIHDSFVAKVVGLRATITLYWNISAAQSASATFMNIQAPPASELTAGIMAIADNDDADADENVAVDNKAITPKKWWRMFTADRISARLSGRTNLFSVTQISGLQSMFNQISKANIDSPTLTGTPRSTTPSSDDNSTRIATTAFVTGKISGFQRIFSGKQGNAFPTSPAPTNGQYFRFNQAVASGLVWRDTDGSTALTAAANGDIAQYNGVRWIKQIKKSGDVFMVEE